jgi:YesN/AraC family two-component response regulator
MYTILIVDDEPLVAKALGRAMSRLGFAVAVAQDPQRAQALVEELSPDVVISDFNMPGMNGLELLRLVETRSPCTVRVILSGCADPHSPIVEYAASDGCLLVRKPWDNKRLAATLHDILRRRGARGDAGDWRGPPAAPGP